MNQQFSEMTGRTKPEAESTESLFPNPKEKREKINHPQQKTQFTEKIMEQKIKK